MRRKYARTAAVIMAALHGGGLRSETEHNSREFGRQSEGIPVGRSGRAHRGTRRRRRRRRRLTPAFRRRLRRHPTRPPPPACRARRKRPGARGLRLRRRHPSGPVSRPADPGRAAARPRRETHVRVVRRARRGTSPGPHSSSSGREQRRAAPFRNRPRPARHSKVRSTGPASATPRSGSGSTPR